MMWKAVRRILSSSTNRERPDSNEYRAVSVGDEVGPQDEDQLEARRHVSGTYWAFWVLGAGVLLSWNVLICTIPLLASFFPAGSHTRTNLASYLSTTFCFGNLICLGLAQRNVGTTPPSGRLRSALILIHITSLVIIVPTIPFILPNSSNHSTALAILLLLTATLSCGTAYLQSSVFALASLWGSPEVLAVMSGQGGIAVIVSFAQVVLAVISTLSKGSDSSGSDSQSMFAGLGLWAISAVGAAGCIYAQKVLEAHVDFENVVAPVMARSQEVQQMGAGSKKGLTRRILRKNAALEWAVAWVFVVTLSVFPPITTAIVSTHSPTPALLLPSVFIPFHFLVFNVGDYIGRTYLPAIPSLLFTNPRHVLSLSIARTLFIPIFLLCNIASSSSTAQSSTPWINSDILYMLILLSFGLSNGYVSSLSMILASSPSLNPKISNEEKDIAGTLAAFCLVAGLAGGSVLSFGVNWLVRGSVFG